VSAVKVMTSPIRFKNLIRTGLSALPMIACERDNKDVPKKQKNKILYLVPFLLILIVFLFIRSRNTGPNVIGSIKRGTIIEAVYGIGTVTPNHIFNVKVGQAGAVKAIFVREGEDVVKGQKLLSFEGVLFKAPFAGTVTSIPYKAGETVFPNLPLLTMQDQRDLYLVVSLEQQGALRVKAKQRASISFDSMRDRKFTGSVRSIFANDNQFLVHIEVDQLPPEVLPGMTADVGIEIGRHENTFIAPIAAINGQKLRLVKNKVIEEVDVGLGVVDGESIEVKSDLLRDGDLVTDGAIKKKK
jgi:membrane fusion protein, macrolide-specific efflux system